MMNKIFILMVINLVLLGANTVQINSTLEKFNTCKFETPQGKYIKIPKDIKTIIVTSEKDTGILVNEYLNIKDKDYLLNNSSIFIADIHNIPSIIRSIFALPKLKKYKHPIYLNYDEKFETFVPNKEGMITIIKVKNGIIIEISFISTEEELEEIILS